MPKSAMYYRQPFCKKLNDLFRSRRTFASMTARTKDLANSILRILPDDKESFTLQRRIALSRAITLIESQSPTHICQANLLLNHVAMSRRKVVQNSTEKRKRNDQHLGNNDNSRNRSFRVGIAGAPGAGKSTFIETFGKLLLDNPKVLEAMENENNEVESLNSPNKLAVVCVDPSSSITGGSILGDKTRMMDLSRHPRAFVRPSPSKGILGGLSSYTNDVITLCEAAGYDLVLVETVGLGQSEIDISQTVDMLILMVSPGGGDSLQGAKKGILELADMIIVNKADGTLLPTARMTASSYKNATHFFRARIEGWETPPVLLASAETGEGIPAVWKEICRYRDIVSSTGQIQAKRSSQARYWLWKHVQELLIERLSSDETIRLAADEVEHDVALGVIAPRAAASKLLDLSKSTSP